MEVSGFVAEVPSKVVNLLTPIQFHLLKTFWPKSSFFSYLLYLLKKIFVMLILMSILAEGSLNQGGSEMGG